METRFKQIRKAKNMSQKEFSGLLGISRSHVAGLELGNKKFLDRLINNICTTFDVNKEWFLTGEGDMFNDPLEGIDADEEVKEVARMYMQLDENMRNIIMKFIKSALEEK